MFQDSYTNKIYQWTYNFVYLSHILWSAVSEQTGAEKYQIQQKEVGWQVDTLMYYRNYIYTCICSA